MYHINKGEQCSTINNINLKYKRKFKFNNNFYINYKFIP